jgi:multipile epidermal growth factor-like domains protein 8
LKVLETFVEFYSIFNLSRQDQLHIDLFVFFSVFFSCFFLFLSACVVFWKIKQGADMRRARRRHVVEMMNMAQRAFSSIILDATNEGQSQKTVGKNKTAICKKDSNYVPVAIESTANGLAAVCTVFIRLPGHRRQQMLCLGSCLIAQPKNNIFLNKAPPRISQQVV